MSYFPASSGSVTTVSVVTANGVSGSVANATTTPAITLTLGAIAPTSVNGITFTGTSSTTMTFPPASASIGYLNIPQNPQSADYTAVLADQGKHLYHPTTDDNPRTFTIPANASVAYVVGTTLTFVNDQNTMTIAITTDTLVWAEDGSTGSRTLAENGVATALKVTSTRWIISGVGLT